MQFLTDFADFPSEQLLLSIIEVDQQLNLNMQYIEQEISPSPNSVSMLLTIKIWIKPHLNFLQPLNFI